MANFYLALVTTPDWDSAITKGFLPTGACLHTNEVEAVKAFGQINLKGYFCQFQSVLCMGSKP